MEWKIGEIKQVNGEWYQCVVAIQGCRECSFRTQDYCTRHSECFSEVRSDGMSVIFKKLEKVGEPFTSVGKLYQHYKVFDIDNVYGDVFLCVHNYIAKTLTIEIKQNKEDMEDKNNAKHSNSESIGKNLKPFSLEAAKSGKPVCTRDGRKARIICFDLQSIEKTPIVAAVQVTDKQEVISHYYEDGRQFVDGISELDLMMLPEKKEGWVNVYKERIYSTKEEAIEATYDGVTYVDTVKVCWEE